MLESSAAESLFHWTLWSAVCMNRTGCFDPVIWKDAFKREVVDGQLTWMFGRNLMYMAEKKQHTEVSSGSQGFRKKFSPRVMTAVFHLAMKWLGSVPCCQTSKARCFCLQVCYIAYFLRVVWPTGGEVLPWAQQLEHMAGITRLDERGLTMVKGRAKGSQWVDKGTVCE